MARSSFSVTLPHNSATSNAAGSASDRRLPFVAAALVGVILIAGTRAIIVARPNAHASHSSDTRATKAPSAELTSSATPSTTATPDVSASSQVSTPIDANRAVTRNAATSQQNTSTSVAPTATSTKRSPLAAALAPEADAKAFDQSSELEEPIELAGETPVATALLAQIKTPVGRGRPARTALDWRTIISRPGITFAFEDITDASSATAAVAGARAIRTHSSIDVTLDMDSLFGWSGMTIYAQHKSFSGRNGSGEGAFMQNYSNIDADRFRALGEVFVEQRLWQDRMRVKAGRLDFNTEFAATDNGGSFLNSSMGFSPSIAAAPTFPLPTAGVNVVLTPRENTTVALGNFNGLDGAPAATGSTSRFQIAQASHAWSFGDNAGRAGIGAYRHTGLFNAITDEDGADPSVNGVRGWFGTLDQTVWTGAARASDETPAASVAAFAQFGHSSTNVQGIHSHQGGGVTFSGLSARRANDVLGIGATYAKWNGGGEAITEVYYAFPVTSHLSLVADWQRVHRHENTFSRWMGNVLTMRSIVSF